MSNDDTATTRTEKGISLARGPALILGTILQVAGLYFLYKQHLFPKFAEFPNGKVPAPGKAFLGIFGANGWTGLLTAAAGGLLLFGAAEHLLAKTMSLIVGIVLGAAAIIALIGRNVLSLAAADGWTEILWGGSAAILLFSTLLPRRKKTVEDDSAAAAPRRRRVDPAPVAREQSCRAVPCRAQSAVMATVRGMTGSWPYATDRECDALARPGPRAACGDSRGQATARVAHLLLPGALLLGRYPPSRVRQTAR
jgi:hypothetical protein